ncbi:MAG: adenine phosphoribosyltransferase [Bacteroidota bacterium]
MTLEERIRSTIRDVPDFPRPGILFRDITPLLHDQKLCTAITDEFLARLSGERIDAIVGTESRGFLFGMLLANRMNVPFILLRKSGKLPYKTHGYEYELEYGKARVEIHIDSLRAGWNVLVHDDLLATGGTAEASANLVLMQKARVAGYAFLVELAFLNGREKLKKYSEKIISLVTY